MRLQWFDRYSWLKRVFRLLLILIPLFFLLTNLIQNWQALLSFQWEFDILRGVSAVICLIGGFSLLPIASQQVLKGMGHTLDYRAAYYGFFIAQLAKYLPGGLWIVPGRIVALKKYAVSAVASSISVIIESSLLVVAGIIVFIPYFFFADLEVWNSGLWLIIALPILSLALFYPPIFNAGLRYLLLRMGYEHKNIALSFRQLLNIILIYILVWLVTGIGFYFLATSVHQIDTIHWFLFIPIYSMGWIVGFMAFLTPGGLGVREGALAVFMAPFLPPPLPALIALIARLWWTLVELFSVLLALIIDKTIVKRKRKAANDQPIVH